MKRPLVRLFQVERLFHSDFKVKLLDKTLAGNIICRDRRSTQRNATPSTASSKARSELSTDKNDASVPLMELKNVQADKPKQDYKPA